MSLSRRRLVALPLALPAAVTTPALAASSPVRPVPVIGAVDVQRTAHQALDAFLAERPFLRLLIEGGEER